MEQNNPSSRFMNFVRNDISSSSATKFFVKDGLFYMKGEGKRPDRVLVPECFREWVLKMHHNIPLAGHQGYKRMANQMSRTLYWPNFITHANRWGRACSACQAQNVMSIKVR